MQNQKKPKNNPTTPKPNPPCALQAPQKALPENSHANISQVFIENNILTNELNGST